jgi:hypothetical protein
MDAYRKHATIFPNLQEKHEHGELIHLTKEVIRFFIIFYIIKFNKYTLRRSDLFHHLTGVNMFKSKYYDVARWWNMTIYVCITCLHCKKKLAYTVKKTCLHCRCIIIKHKPFILNHEVHLPIKWRSRSHTWEFCYKWLTYTKLGTNDCLVQTQK